jgi:hypothetical protein
MRSRLLQMIPALVLGGLLLLLSNLALLSTNWNGTAATQDTAPPSQDSGLAAYDTSRWGL